MQKLMIDIGTIRSSLSILKSGPKYRIVDSEIISLSTLIENILLADELVIPDIPHSLSNKLIKESGIPVKIASVDYEPLIEASREWLKSLTNLRDILNLSGLRLNYLAGDSGDSGVSLMLGISKDEHRKLFEHNRKQSYSLSLTKLDLDPIFNYSEQCAGEASSVVESLISKTNWMDFYDDLKPQFDSPHYWKGFMFEDLTEQFGEPPNATDSYEYFHRLQWLLFRAKLYNLCAEQLGVVYAPHPLRTIATASVLTPIQRGHPPTSVSDLLKKVFEENASFVSQELGINIEPLRIAPLFPYVLSKSKSAESLIEKTLKLRESKLMTDVRSEFELACNAVEKGNLDVLTKYAKNMRALERYIKSEAGISDSESSAKVSLFGLSVPIPQKINESIIGASSGAGVTKLRVFRDAYGELKRSWMLGELRDRLHL